MYLTSFCIEKLENILSSIWVNLRKPSGKIVRSKEVFSIKAGHIDIETYEENKVVEEEAEDITDTLTTFKIGKNFFAI